MSSKQAVIDAVKGTHRYSSPHGVSCYFVPLDNEWGVKVYGSRFKRDDAHARQHAAAGHCLGPETGECFDLPDHKYCYVTERAELLDIVDEYGDFNYDDDERWQGDHWDEIEELVQDLRNYLEWGFYDVHAGNLGWLHGKLVCIDFGND